jgi:hypothetical protein
MWETFPISASVPTFLDMATASTAHAVRSLQASDPHRSGRLTLSQPRDRARLLELSRRAHLASTHRRNPVRHAAQSNYDPARCTALPGRVTDKPRAVNLV